MTKENSKKTEILGVDGLPIKKEIKKIKKKIRKDIGISIPIPKKIYSQLGRKVYGNHRAKKLLSIGMKKVEHRINHPNLGLQKSNMLIIGDTGCGKTLLVDTLAQISKLPLIKTKMSGLSTEGFVGNSIQEVFQQLDLMNYYGNDFSENIDMDLDNPESFFVENARYSIVYLDEIDKIAKSENSNFSGGLQNELIGYIEDAMVLDDSLSTKDMLFIGTGAFIGLEKIIESRLNSSNGTNIGFGSNLKRNEKLLKKELFAKVTPEDLIEYGLKPELVGRFPIIGNVEQLNEESLIKIMDMKTSYLSIQRQLIKQEYGITIDIPKKSKQLIAKKAAQMGTNARALQGLTDKLLDEIYFSPSECGRRVYFTEEYTRELLEY